MIRTIALGEVAALLLIALIVVTQIIVPGIRGTKLFPLFRSRRRGR